MASIPNTQNYGIAQGKISNMVMFPNKDGSKKFMITIAAKNAYANQDGTYGCQYVRTEGFVPANASSDGVYGIIEVGDYVQVNYIILNDDYKDRTGKWHYNQVLRIQGVDILESKAAKADRKARKAAQDAQTQAQMVPSYPEEATSEDPVFN